MELEHIYLGLDALLAFGCGYLWVGLNTERKLKNIYKKRVEVTWKAHETLLHANIELHEKILRIKATLGYGK